MNNSLIKEGLRITKTILFRVLIIHAGSFLRKPGRVWKLTKDAADRVQSYQSVGEFTHDIVDKVKQLCRMTRAYVRGEYEGITRTQVLMIIGSLLYFIIPVDMVPDTIPIIGYLDDLSLFSWLFFAISAEMEEYQEWEEAGKTGRHRDEETRGQGDQETLEP